MSEEIGAAVILIVIFGFIYAIIALSIRKKERMALLAKGVDPSFFYKSKPERATNVKYGMFLIGIALGIFIGNVLDAYTTLETEVSYFSMIFLFGGIALVASYFVTKNIENKEDSLTKD